MFGTQELIIILGIAFLIFGGKKLPEIGSGLGKAITSFKKGLHDVESTGKSLAEDVPGVKEVASLKQEIEDIKDMPRK
jgi:sec-independent protein translocase protein TatA